MRTIVELEIHQTLLKRRGSSNFVQVVTIQINFSMNELAVFDINNNSLSPGEEVSSIQVSSTRPALCGSLVATIASAIRGQSSARPCHLTCVKEALEELLNSAWRGQRMSEERETLGTITLTF